VSEYFVLVEDLLNYFSGTADEVGAMKGTRSDELFFAHRRPAAPGHDLRPAFGDEVESGKLLEDAHGIVGTEHGDGAAETNRLGARRCGGEDHRRGRGNEIRTMVLAQGEDIETYLIGQFDNFEHIFESLGGADLLASMGIRVKFGERIETKFKFVVCSNSELLIALYRRCSYYECFIIQLMKIQADGRLQAGGLQVTWMRSRLKSAEEAKV